MEKSEVIKILYYLEEYYRRPDQAADKEKIRVVADAWLRHLGKYPAAVVQFAVDQHIGKSAFYPAVSDIVAICNSISKPPQLTWGEAWGEAMKAVSMYGRYEPDKAFAMMSPETLAAVKLFGWSGFGGMCNITEDQIGTARAQFRQIFEQLQERKAAYVELPEPVKKLLEGMKQLEGGKPEAENDGGKDDEV